MTRRPCDANVGIRSTSRNSETSTSSVGAQSGDEGSPYPVGPLTSASEFSTTWLGNIDGLAIMADHLYQIANTLNWATKTGNATGHPAVAVRNIHTNTVAVRPTGRAQDVLKGLIKKLEAGALLVLQNDVTNSILELVPPMSQSIILADGRNIQIHESIERVPQLSTLCKSGFYLIRDKQAALVWTKDVKSIIAQCHACEQALTMTLWKNNNLSSHTWALQGPDATGAKSRQIKVEVREVVEESEVGSDWQDRGNRPTRWLWPVSVAITFVLMGLIIGSLLSDLVLAVIRDGTFLQALFVLYLPLTAFLSSFFLSIIVVGVLQLIGPVTQMESNSRTFSGKRLKFNIAPSRLPHITIQCPIYKEDLWDVIHPTMETVKEAIVTYQSQGGTASVIVNDDGMRHLHKEDREARKAYYAHNNIGWIARPKHGDGGFERKGAFKKASNLNFGLRTSLLVDDRYEQLAQQEGPYAETYLNALRSVIEESCGQIWASGDIGLGELILLIDADTRVPRDCFLDAVKEFYDTPSLAILQHPSGVLQVANNFWENSLAHFTRNNYFGSRYVVSGGDATPFFGHNAFLRFSAIADVATLDHNGQLCYWSEEHVSEDFELSLKLLSSGYSTRMVGYSDMEFQEGVCLTVYDELNRWEKYAFGVSELIFNPLTLWFSKGPFTPLFRHFLCSSMDLSAKCSSIFYMGTYYGIGLTWILCVINYFLIGWYPELIRSYYVDCLEVLISVSVIFGIKDAIVGPLVQYRLKEVTLFRGFVNSINHFIITSLFMQGMSMHVSKCLVWHLSGYKMSWEATNKSVSDNATLWQDLPVIWKQFKAVYIIIAVLSSMVIVLATVVPYYWKITDPKGIIPLVWMLFWHASVPLLMHNRSFLAESRRFTLA